MKKGTKILALSKTHGIYFVIMSLLLSSVAMAQDKKVDVNINTNSGGFFASPWVWVVGGAIFILLLVALLRSGGNKN